MWSHVKFVDISDAIEYRTLNFTYDKPVNRYTLLSIFEYSFLEEEAQKSVYIENGYLFSEKVLQAEGTGQGFEAYSRDAGFETLVRKELENLRFISESSENTHKNEMNTDLRLLPAKEGHKGFCSIKIREELVFSDVPNQKHESVISNSIALLIPSANFKFKSVKEVPLTNIFIKSFSKTVTKEELKKFNIRFYIGYDKGDPIFDINGHESREYFKSLLPENVSVQFVLLPKANWLTFIWNRLFVQAYMDGYKYFLQINDDVEFLSTSWITTITDLSADKVAVVGLSSNKRKCEVFEQAMINRHHYKIFQGLLYPVSIRDYYSDDWITRVYSEKSICTNSTMLNHNSGNLKRYVGCDHRNLQKSLTHGQALVKKYKIDKI